MRSYWQNFEKAKQEWETNKYNQKEREPQSLRIKHQEKPSLQYTKPEAPPPSTQLSGSNGLLLPSAPISTTPSIVDPQTPSSRQKSLTMAQEELKTLEMALNETTDTELNSKLTIKIDQLKNRIATLRGQKALYESNRSSRLLTNMMKTMEKEVNYEENKRKQQLERFTKKSNIKNDEVPCKALEMVSPAATRIFSTEASTPRGLNSSNGFNNILQQDEKQLLTLKKEILLKREKEITQREQVLQETWMRVPGARELIENVNLTLSKLTMQKGELDSEREAFEVEKLEMFKIRNKFLEQISNIKN